MEDLASMTITLRCAPDELIAGHVDPGSKLSRSNRAWLVDAFIDMIGRIAYVHGLRRRPEHRATYTTGEWRDARPTVNLTILGAWCEESEKDEAEKLLDEMLNRTAASTQALREMLIACEREAFP